MKYYDGGATFLIIALLIGAFVAMVSVATNQGGEPVYSTYVGGHGGLSYP